LFASETETILHNKTSKQNCLNAVMHELTLSKRDVFMNGTV